MAELLTLPLYRVQDANGTVYPGAKLYAYLTGTTTPASVYTTSALDVAHPSPVVADSGGFLPAIFTDPTVTYRFVAKTAADAAITGMDFDPVSALQGSNVRFVQAGDGAVIRTVQDKLRETVSAFDFIPTAIQAAIEAGTNTDDLSSYLQEALDTGKLVFLPLGTYWIGSPLNVPSGGGLAGHGYGAILKAMDDFGNLPMIRNVTIAPANSGERDQALTFVGFKIDGNRANNSTATEFGAGIRLRAVDGVLLDVWIVDCMGDGITLMYGGTEDGSVWRYDVGCQRVRGFALVENCFRQSVTLACVEAFDLSIQATDAGYFALDIEPDNEANFVRNGVIRLAADSCGQNATGSGGAAAIIGTNSAGDAVCDVRNIVLEIQARNCNAIQFGGGVNYRDVTDVTIRGSIHDQTGPAVVGQDGVGISRVTLNVDAKAPSGAGLSASGVGDIINGAVRVRNSGGVGVQLTGAAGGTLQVQVDAAAEQGLGLSNTSNMNFPNAQITGCTSSGVYLAGTSSGNRFPGLRSTGAGTFGYGFQEADTANNNRVTDARLSGNGAGTAALLGATSLVELAVLIGKATFDAASVASGAQAALGTVTVTGALGGDAVQVQCSLATGGMLVWGQVTAADTVTVYGTNLTGGAIDLASATYKATVMPRVTA